MMAAITALGAAAANAQPQVDCFSFHSQAAAQEYFDQFQGDPAGLDADGDGVACEEHAVGGSSSTASASSSAGSGASSQYQYGAAQEQYLGTTTLPSTGGPNLALLLVSLAAMATGVLFGYLARGDIERAGRDSEIR